MEYRRTVREEAILKSKGIDWDNALGYVRQCKENAELSKTCTYKEVIDVLTTLNNK